MDKRRPNASEALSAITSLYDYHETGILAVDPDDDDGGAVAEDVATSLNLLQAFLEDQNADPTPEPLLPIEDVSEPLVPITDDLRDQMVTWLGNVGRHRAEAQGPEFSEADFAAGIQAVFYAMGQGRCFPIGWWLNVLRGEPIWQTQEQKERSRIWSERNEARLVASSVATRRLGEARKHIRAAWQQLEELMDASE